MARRPSRWSPGGANLVSRDEFTVYCRTGKVGHTSKKSARRHCKQLIGQSGHGNLSVYRCRTCGGWHVGHKGNE